MYVLVLLLYFNPLIRIDNKLLTISTYFPSLSLTGLLYTSLITIRDATEL